MNTNTAAVPTAVAASTTTARPVSGSGWVAGSSLAAAETAFDLLCTDPAPLALDCTGITDTGAGGLPAGSVPLPAVRQWLLAHPADHATSDEVWRRLILAARLAGPAWVVGAVGMAIPALAAMSRELRGRFTDADAADIDAELLTGFLEALRDRLDREQAGLLPALRMAAWRAAWRLLTRDLDVEPLDDIEHTVPASRTPRPMVAHPDLLVLRAVQLGVLHADDAEAWIDIRLGHKAPEPHAARLGITVDALRMRLSRADRALHAALRSGALADGVGAVERTRLAAAATGRAVLRRRHTAAAATAARIGRLVRQPAPTAGVA